MRYLVKARLKSDCGRPLRTAIEDGSLGRGSVAGDEYQQNMKHARLADDGTVQWVETCFCATPLAEERPYWEKFFELLDIKDAHSRKNCRHENGTEPWACCDCDCTTELESRVKESGKCFLEELSPRPAGANHPGRRSPIRRGSGGTSIPAGSETGAPGGGSNLPSPTSGASACLTFWRHG